MFKQTYLLVWFWAVRYGNLQTYSLLLQTVFGAIYSHESFADFHFAKAGAHWIENSQSKTAYLLLKILVF